MPWSIPSLRLHSTAPHITVFYIYYTSLDFHIHRYAVCTHTHTLCRFILILVALNWPFYQPSRMDYHSIWSSTFHFAQFRIVSLLECIGPQHTRRLHNIDWWHANSPKSVSVCMPRRHTVLLNYRRHVSKPNIFINISDVRAQRARQTPELGVYGSYRRH